VIELYPGFSNFAFSNSNLFRYVSGCGRSAKARNLCIEHGGVKLCKVPTCPKMDRGRGFCSKHGNLLGLGGLKCTAHSCTKSAVSRGLCCEHGGEGVPVQVESS
jgi:hypothetical protein